MVGNQLVKHYAGSIAYGTNTPSSDTDFRGIYCDPPRGIITPWTKPRTETWEDPSEEDTVLFELHKYMDGYVNGSPSILETLWVEDSDIVQRTEAYDYLRSNAQALLSKKLRYTFGGYALQQMKRIKGHNKWINNPQPEPAPIRKDYFKLIQNFTEEQIFSSGFNISSYNYGHLLVPYGNNIFGLVESERDSLFNADGSIKKVTYSELPDSVKKAHPKFIVKLNEEVFKQEHEMWKNYWKWKRERNETRAALESEHGYDCKHGMHIVRLLRMGAEVLETGIVQVKRPDAEELLSIRNGAWSYEEMLEWATEADNKLDDLVKKSNLPDKPDYELAKKILINTEEIVNEILR